MGTWDTGHFDNDTAADFAGDLDSATAERRVEVVREALARVAGGGGPVRTAGADPSGPDAGEAVVAVAAAALVAAQCPGGPPVETVYGPDEPLPRFPEELRESAFLALERVLAAGSELAELWADAEGWTGPWRRGVEALRDSLMAVAAP